jgi:AcrR family transcriptional regulator
MSAERPRQLLPRDERRAQILRTAAAAFASAGYSATSMDDVAKSAGITKLIVYRHFESKAELYRTILEHVAQLLAAEWTEEVAEGRESGSGVRVMLRVARLEPDSFRLLFVHSAREPEFAEFHEKFRELQLSLAQQRVSSAVTDVMLRDWVASMAVDCAVKSVLNWMDIGSVDRDEEFCGWAAEALAAMFLSAVGEDG